LKIFVSSFSPFVPMSILLVGSKPIMGTETYFLMWSKRGVAHRFAWPRSLFDFTDKLN